MDTWAEVSRLTVSQSVCLSVCLIRMLPKIYAKIALGHKSCVGAKAGRSRGLFLFGGGNFVADLRSCARVNLDLDE